MAFSHGQNLSYTVYYERIVFRFEYWYNALVTALLWYWHIIFVFQVNVKCLASHNADFRLTCVTVMRAQTSVKEEVSEGTVNTDSVVEDRLSDEEDDTEQIESSTQRKKSPKQKAEKKLKQSMKNKPVKRLGKQPLLKSTYSKCQCCKYMTYHFILLLIYCMWPCGNGKGNNSKFSWWTLFKIIYSFY
jgi:hypothetical protein